MSKATPDEIQQARHAGDALMSAALRLHHAGAPADIVHIGLAAIAVRFGQVHGCEPANIRQVVLGEHWQRKLVALLALAFVLGFGIATALFVWRAA